MFGISCLHVTQHTLIAQTLHRLTIKLNYQDLQYHIQLVTGYITNYWLSYSKRHSISIYVTKHTDNISKSLHS